MTDAEPRHADLRSGIAKALEGWLTPEQMSALLEEVLAIEKGARGWCPSCRKHVQVTVKDAKAVVSAMADLANQGFGRPQEAALVDEDRIVFKRLTKLDG